VLRIRIRTSGREWILTLLFYLLLLQNPLEEISSIFSYIDEGVAFLGLLLLGYSVFSGGYFRIKKAYAKIALALFIFLLSGMLGNFIYRYQATSAVIKDIYVNFKFFFSIIAGYELYRLCGPERCKRVFLTHARISAAVLFALTFTDLVFHVFESPGLRYGIRVVKLSFSHPTYLAGAGIFLLAALTFFYEKKNDLYLMLAAAVTIFTFRGKAIASVGVYFLIYIYILKQQKKFRIWHLLIIGAVAVTIAWDQFAFYYIDLEGESARSALTQMSFVIAKDYFPIGTGFGTYASNVAAEHYSPVYYMYGLSSIQGLTESRMAFGSDTFWPIIIGQTGVIGTICYVFVLFTLFRRVLAVRSKNLYAYTSGIFMFAYLMISSTSEPTFCNSVSIPFALLIGFIFAIEDNKDTVPAYRKEIRS